MTDLGESVLTTLLDRLKAMATTETVVGEPIRVDAMTIIPVCQVSIGLGVGVSADKAGPVGSGGGGGGGMKVTPVAFLVVQGGAVSLLNIGEGGSWTNLIEKVPDLIEKVALAVTKRKAD